MTSIVNVSAYRFIDLPKDHLPTLRTQLLKKANACQLKGTILLGTEGINLFLAGERDDIDAYKSFLNHFEQFSNLFYKESFSTYRPFTRMLVRIKKEIIPMGRREVMPAKKTAMHLAPEVFKQWYEKQHDMIVLDTRNDYEVALGTFKNAIDLNIEHFRDFPDAIKLLPKEIKQKPIVTFCTGGIRCEKAAEYMLQQGFEQVYQLDGGIINYFEKCGGAFYEGECFVFDKRVALDTNLQETQTTQCYKCREPLSVAQQTQEVCPHCHKARES